MNVPDQVPVSVCIPTRNRVHLLEEAIESCINQTSRPMEILVGDDSDDDRAEAIARKFQSFGTRIQYYRNAPKLGQADNINLLFDKAIGSHIVVLHDDDVLLPRGIEILYRLCAVNANISAAYGKQKFINNDGQALDDIRANRFFFKTQLYAKKTLSPREAALVRQFPNDAYMVKADLAKQTRFRSAAGDWCDFDFGIRLAEVSQEFRFLDEYVSAYRFTAEAISRSPKPRDTCMYAYDNVVNYQASARSKWAKDRAIAGILPHLISALAQEGDYRTIEDIVFSGNYPISQRCSFRGLYHLSLCTFPSAITSIRKVTTKLRVRLRRT